MPQRGDVHATGPRESLRDVRVGMEPISALDAAIAGRSVRPGRSFLGAAA